MVVVRVWMLKAIKACQRGSIGEAVLTGSTTQVCLFYKINLCCINKFALDMIAYEAWHFHFKKSVTDLGRIS